MGYMKSKSWCSLSAIPHHQAWLQGSPNDATTGPKARASAPSERNMPITVPFCWTVPNDDATAVRNVGTVAAASNTQSTGLQQVVSALASTSQHMIYNTCHMVIMYWVHEHSLLSSNNITFKFNIYRQQTKWAFFSHMSMVHLTLTKPAKPGWASCLLLFL